MFRTATITLGIGPHFYFLHEVIICMHLQLFAFSFFGLVFI